MKYILLYYFIIFIFNDSVRKIFVWEMLFVLCFYSFAFDLYTCTNDRKSGWEKFLSSHPSSSRKRAQDFCRARLHAHSRHRGCKIARKLTARYNTVNIISSNYIYIYTLYNTQGIPFYILYYTCIFMHTTAYIRENLFYRCRCTLSSWWTLHTRVHSQSMRV